MCAECVCVSMPLTWRGYLTYAIAVTNYIRNLYSFTNFSTTFSCPFTNEHPSVTIYWNILYNLLCCRNLHPFSIGSVLSMPAEPRNTSASRKNTRKVAYEEELESKRSRGEVSCAECKRSKLKCDKVGSYHLGWQHVSDALFDKEIPCGSCARRGCSNICPNGICLPSSSLRSAPHSWLINVKINAPRI